MKAVTVKVFKKGAFDVGGSGKQMILKVDRIKPAQIVEDNKVRVEIEDAVQFLRQILCSKESEVHFLGVAVGDRRTGKKFITNADVHKLGTRDEGAKRRKIILGQTVVCDIDGKHCVRIGLGQRIEHDT